MLTLYSCPKPFVDPHIRLIQRNAIGSWLRLQPRPEILLLGDEPGVAETAAEFGLRHVGGLATNEFGTPLVDSIFARGEREGSGNLLCYVNADIVLFPDFARVAEEVGARHRHFLVVGQRWDLDLATELDFISLRWEEALRRLLAAQGVLHPETGIDYFLYPRGFWRAIPPFALGRTLWDNWLLFRARQLGAALIDATEVLTIVHQNHDYAHVPGGKTAAWQGEEARRNGELAGQGRFTLLDANWLLTPHGLFRSRKPAHRLRAREAWPILHPTWARPYRFLYRAGVLTKRKLASMAARMRRLGR